MCVDVSAGSEFSRLLSMVSDGVRSGAKRTDFTNVPRNGCVVHPPGRLHLQCSCGMRLREAGKYVKRVFGCSCRVTKDAAVSYRSVNTGALEYVLYLPHAVVAANGVTRADHVLPDALSVQGWSDVIVSALAVVESVWFADDTLATKLASDVVGVVNPLRLVWTLAGTCALQRLVYAVPADFTLAPLRQRVSESGLVSSVAGAVQVPPVYCEVTGKVAVQVKCLCGKSCGTLDICRSRLGDLDFERQTPQVVVRHSNFDQVIPHERSYRSLSFLQVSGHGELAPQLKFIKSLASVLSSKLPLDLLVILLGSSLRSELEIVLALLKLWRPMHSYMWYSPGALMVRPRKIYNSLVHYPTVRSALPESVVQWRMAELEYKSCGVRLAADLVPCTKAAVTRTLYDSYTKFIAVLSQVTEAEWYWFLYDCGCSACSMTEANACSQLRFIQAYTLPGFFSSWLRSVRTYPVTGPHVRYFCEVRNLIRVYLEAVYRCSLRSYDSLASTGLTVPYSYFGMVRSGLLRSFVHWSTSLRNLSGDDDMVSAAALYALPIPLDEHHRQSLGIRVDDSSYTVGEVMSAVQGMFTFGQHTVFKVSPLGVLRQIDPGSRCPYLRFCVDWYTRYVEGLD